MRQTDLSEPPTVYNDNWGWPAAPRDSVWNPERVHARSVSHARRLCTFFLPLLATNQSAQRVMRERTPARVPDGARGLRRVRSAAA